LHECLSSLGNLFGTTTYLPDTAQAQSETRRKNAKQPFKNVSKATLELVKKGLKDYHSPEQIAGRLKRASQESLSHVTIYQMIYQNYRDCGKYQEYLRGQTRKKKESKWSQKQAWRDSKSCRYLRTTSNR
jgi:IS30 family transposase